MITQAILKELISYNKSNGIFEWKIASTRINIGDECVSIDSHGYRRIKIRGLTYKAHRLAWLYVYGKFPDDHIDHINHDRLDNRIINLRQASNYINNTNRSKQKNKKNT